MPKKTKKKKIIIIPRPGQLGYHRSPKTNCLGRNGRWVLAMFAGQSCMIDSSWRGTSHSSRTRTRETASRPWRSLPEESVKRGRDMETHLFTIQGYKIGLSGAPDGDVWSPGLHQLEPSDWQPQKSSWQQRHTAGWHDHQSHQPPPTGILPSGGSDWVSRHREWNEGNLRQRELVHPLWFDSTSKIALCSSAYFTSHNTNWHRLVIRTNP